MAVLGYVLQRSLFQSAITRGELTTLIVTFGLSIVIENGLLQFFTANSRGIGVGSTRSISRSFSIGVADARSPGSTSCIFVLAVVVLLGLQYFLSSSKYGRLIRAVADDREAAQLSGVDYRHVFGIAAAIAFGTVALAGIAYGMTPRSVPRPRHRHDPAVRVRLGGDRRPRLAVGHPARRHRPRRRPGRSARRSTSPTRLLAGYIGLPARAGDPAAGAHRAEVAVMSVTTGASRTFGRKPRKSPGRGETWRGAASARSSWSSCSFAVPLLSCSSGTTGDHGAGADRADARLACGTCSPGTPAWSRSGSRRSSGSARTSC